MEKTGRKNLTE